MLASWKKLYGISIDKIKIMKQKTLATLKEEIFAAIDKGSRGFFAFIITAIIKKQAEEKPGQSSTIIYFKILALLANDYKRRLKYSHSHRSVQLDSVHAPLSVILVLVCRASASAVRPERYNRDENLIF